MCLIKKEEKMVKYVIANFFTLFLFVYFTHFFFLLSINLSNKLILVSPLQLPCYCSPDLYNGIWFLTTQKNILI